MRKFMALVASSLFLACSAAPAQPAAAPADGSASSTPADGSASSTPGVAGGPAGTSAAASDAASGQPVAPGSTLGTGNQKEDAHWIQADDYFVAPRKFEKGWLYVHVGKMKEPPKGTDGEALFFLIHDGRDERSANYYRTRLAVQADLVLGNTLICFDDNKRDKVYGAPRDKDNARPGGWWIAKITDLSDLAKGYATLAGSFHCAPAALRAIVK